MTVSLWGPDGRIAKAVTDARGRFFFSSFADDPAQPRTTGSDVYGVTALIAGGQYNLILDNLVDYAGGPLTGLTLTTRNAGEDRTIDSDGEVVNMFARTTFTGPVAGSSDHTRDLGFLPLPSRR